MCIAHVGAVIVRDTRNPVGVFHYEITILIQTVAFEHEELSDGIAYFHNVRGYAG
ncbi:hypothetical protein Barb7_03030 [Bacteroidales bacterium Barb7]|nr:hypothetical protein Barb7_03030 [Bacteroidales bacterium Barb7]